MWPSGVTAAGEHDILGSGPGAAGGEGAKYWFQVLTEIKNRGVEDVCIVVCDGLKGLPDAINSVWELALVQTCVVHLIRNTFRYAARQYWDADVPGPAAGLHRGRTPTSAADRFEEFAAEVGRPLPGRSASCGATPGPSSCRSWTTTSRSVGSSAPPTRSSR